MIVAIHTSPLSSFSETGNFIFTRIVSRVAVPFFFMTSGFFLISRYTCNAEKLEAFIKKTTLIYGVAILLYIPTTFEWYVNLNGKPNVKATFTAEGRKKNCLIRLEEIERISSLHRKENESNAQFIKNPCLLTYLHRLPSRTPSKGSISRIIIIPSARLSAGRLCFGRKHGKI